MNLQKINDRDGEMQASMTMSIFFEPDGASSAQRANGVAGGSKMASTR
jgi:hypothetical protein